MTAEFPRRVPQACGKSPLSWPDGTLFLDLYLQSVSSGIGKRALLARGTSDSAMNERGMDRDPQGTLQLSPANIFIKANVSSPLGTQSLLSTSCFSELLRWRMSSEGRHPSGSQNPSSPFSLLHSLLLKPPAAALLWLLRPAIVCPDILGCLQLPEVLSTDGRAGPQSQGQVTSSVAPQNKQCMLSHLLHPTQLPS